MKCSEDIGALSTALNGAQKNIGAAVKSADNPFFKSKYADLGDVIKTIKGPMLEEGLSYVQHPVSSDGGVGVCTRLMHTSGQWLESEFTVPMAKADPQGAGSAITYCRRYALAAMFGVPQADDDANAATFVVDDPFTVIQKDEYDRILDERSAVDAVIFERGCEEEVMSALFNSAPQGQKTAQKSAWRELSKKGWEALQGYADAFKELVKAADPAAAENLSELTEKEKSLVWGLLTKDEQEKAKALLTSEAA